MYKLSKYNWAEACQFFPGFRNAPGVLRLAWVICSLYNEKLGCAWPTRETLAQLLGAPPESISRWLKTLFESRALTGMPLKNLPSEVRTKIGRSSKRAQVYVINFGWAQDVLELRDTRAAERQAELRAK
jgi:hypothetical protein